MPQPKRESAEAEYHAPLGQTCLGWAAQLANQPDDYGVDSPHDRDEPSAPGMWHRVCPC